MSHRTIIIEQVILPSPDSQVSAHDQGSMIAEVRYTPPDNATPAQVGDQVQSICKRLSRLADSDPQKSLSVE